eukprot:EG_transcript_1119
MPTPRQRSHIVDARPHCIQVESLSDVEVTSPQSGTSLRSSPASAAVSGVVQVIEQPTGNHFFDGDEYDEAEETVDAPLPSQWSIARQHSTWLLLPLILLAGALVGSYFLMDNGCIAGAMVLYGVVDLLVLALCAALLIMDSRRLLLQFREGLDFLLGCNADQVYSVLSHDPRVRYLQALVFNLRLAIGMYDPNANAAAADPLDFIRMDLKHFASAPDGFVVLDPAGTILWCNAALQRYFGYPEEALVSENIRLLIPPPYNAAHDSLMRKYDRHSSVKRIVGCIRRVPVVDKAGRQSCVELSVKERIDPFDGTSNLFIGAMKFPEGPELPRALQQDVFADTDVVDACQRLSTRREHFLVMDAKGVILFANPGLTGMLGWTQRELMGSNVAMLMNPEVGDVHDAYLARCTAKCRELQPTGQWPPSTIVGRGRDLYARCRRGNYVRIWLTAHRIDAPSRLPEDCWLMGVFVYIQGKDAGGGSPRKANLPLSPTGRGRQPTANSPTARRRQPSVTFSQVGSKSALAQLRPNLSSFTRKRCTVVLFDLYGLNTKEEFLHDNYSFFLTLLVNACHKYNAQLHGPVGDRAAVTLNLISANASQRSSAGLLMQYVLDNFRANTKPAVVQLYAAGTVAEALHATLDRHPIMVNESLELAACMLDVAAEAKVQHGLIDPTLHDELQYAYECRLINTVTLQPTHKASQTLPLYELFSAKDLDEDEWMYQIKPKDKGDPFRPWQECWACLQRRPARELSGQLEAGDSEPACDAALRCLERHTAAFPNDPTAVWLRQAVLQRKAGRDLPGVERAGKLRYTAFLRTTET